MHLRYILLFLNCLFIIFHASAQQQSSKSTYQDSFQLRCIRAEAPVQVDGILNDAVWQHADRADQFYTKWPRAGEPALVQTEVKVAHDAKYLYIGATCHGRGNYIIQSLKRDAQYWDSDGIAVVLDPTNQSQKGYFFGVSQLGVQTEGIFTGDGEDEDIFTWDNKWFSAASGGNKDTIWYVEMAIPLAILRFDETNATWGINFIRNDPGNGFWHTWTNIPLNFNGTDLGYAGKLVWPANEMPQRSKRNVNISPYISTSANRDYTLPNGGTSDLGLNYGVDAKVGLGTGLNLDLTFKPDFSQVEVDEQVVNLTRFNVALPEKRTFFLENADIFGKFGIPPIRPFFSRRIGLNADGEPQPILFGARLTGALGTKTQIGVLNMQTANTDANDGQNFTALSAHRVIFGRTTVSGYFHNRQNARQGADHRRNAGAEFVYMRPDGRWSGWATVHKSFEPQKVSKSAWSNAGFGYFGPRFQSFIDYIAMGRNYRTDLGLENRINNYDAARDTTIRIGYQFIFSETILRFPSRKANSKLNISELRFESFSVLNPDFTANEQNNTLNYDLRFKNTTSLSFLASRHEAWVPVSFRFDGKDESVCPALPAAYYRYYRSGVSWESDGRKRLNLKTGVETGSFYSGTNTGASLSLSYRVQPYGKLTFAAQYNQLDFPEPYCDIRVVNITPRVEVFFHRNLNLTMFMQYNNQANQWNFNSRVQWRFRPMSDLYVVYTSNAQATSRATEARGLAAKVNWWF
jgi:Domain of unknown function (DUF5916)/Carbohydrate family 9 binding domain-like